ncbi:MAG: 23S rRNA (adenine(2503)-C(2))-methyltransferase RlmN [Nitrospiraceae bacterium]|nr:MAG: 23S rRNA (adenine(2503)-C(2))-methyltransferase RlmN [Nitrospiraceae bacterium]
MKTNIKELSQEETVLFLERLGQKPYRTRQLTDWIYKKLAASFDEMTDLPGDLRAELASAAYLSRLNLLNEQTSRDGTRKFLFQLQDGETIESVLIPGTRGPGRYTLCISSQVGCAARCRFCVTGRLGLIRNLKAVEIVDQVIAVRRSVERGDGPEAPSVTNIVLMGMGEPLHNFTEVRRALVILTGLMGFSKRRITLSTSGIATGIEKLARVGPLVNLAVSLNATTDKVRSRIMPVNRKYPLRVLMKACRDFPLPPGRRITFEYVLLGGVNDTREDALRLVRLLKGIKSKVNLIPCNPAGADAEFQAPSEQALLTFQDILRQAGMTVIVRKSMGADIAAACGQLKAAYGR